MNKEYLNKKHICGRRVSALIRKKKYYVEEDEEKLGNSLEEN